MHSVKHKLGTWTEEEDQLLAQWQAEYGNRWAEVAKHIRGKTGQQCAQRWRHRVNPNISREKWTEEEDQRLEELVKEHGHSWAEIARNLPGRTDQQCMGRWRRHVDPSLRRDEWDPEEDDLLSDLVQDYGSAWSDISKYMDGRSAHQCRLRWCQLSGAEQSSKISRSAAKSVSKSTSKAARSSSSTRGAAGHSTAAHHQHFALAKRLEYADPAFASGPAAGLAAGATAQASGCSLRRLSVSGATPGFGREASAAWTGEAPTAVRTHRSSRSARSSRAVRRLSTTSEVCSGAMEEGSTDHEDGDEPSAFTLRKTTARTAAKAAAAAGVDAGTEAPLAEVPDLAGPSASGGASRASMQPPPPTAPGGQLSGGGVAAQSPAPVALAAPQAECGGSACAPFQQCSRQHSPSQPGPALTGAEQPRGSHQAPCPTEPAQQEAITAQATTGSGAPMPRGDSPSAAAAGGGVAAAPAAANLMESPLPMASPQPHLVAKGGLGVATAQPTLPAKRPRGRPWLLVRPLELPGAAPGQLRPGQAVQPQEEEEEESPALTQTLGPSLDLISPSRTLSHAPLPQPPTYTPPSSVRKRALPTSRIATFGPRLPPLAIPGEDAAAGTTPAKAQEGAYTGDVTPMRTTGLSAKGSQQEELAWALTPNVLTLLQSPQPRSGGGMDPLLSPEFGGLLTPEWAKRDRSQPPATGGWSSGRSRAQRVGEPAGRRREDLASSLDMALFGSSPKKAKVEPAGLLAPALTAPAATTINGPSASSASWLSMGNTATPGAGIAATTATIAATAGCPREGEEGTLAGRGSLGNVLGDGNPSAAATASHHLLLPGSAGRSALAAALEQGLGLASTAKTGPPPPASGLGFVGGGRTLTGMKALPPPIGAASSAPLTSASVRVQLRTLLESL